MEDPVMELERQMERRQYEEDKRKAEERLAKRWVSMSHSLAATVCSCV